VRWETEQSFDGKLYQEYLYQKLLKSGNWFSSYSQKCWGCFFETQCIWGDASSVLRLYRSSALHLRGVTMGSNKRMYCFQAPTQKGRQGGGARGAPDSKTIFETLSYCSQFLTNLAKYNAVNLVDTMFSLQMFRGSVCCSVCAQWNRRDVAMLQNIYSHKPQILHACSQGQSDHDPLLFFFTMGRGQGHMTTKLLSTFSTSFS